MERREALGIMITMLLMGMFGLTVGSTPIVAEEWIPYVPEPWQWWPKEWSLIHWTIGGISYINVTLVFPDSGYMVADLGAVVKDGYEIWVDSQIWDWTGPALMVITKDSYTYDLGYLKEGNYTFTFKVWGYPVKSISFIVTILGDVNGDKKVDASDLHDFSNAYGSDPTKPNWNLYCDFNEDNKVEASDLFDVSKNYGKTGP